MKKTILFALLVFCINSSKGQKSIKFDARYLPNFNYTTTLKQVSENNLKYIASEDILNELKIQGIANPTIDKDTTLVKSLCKAGEQKGKVFPIEVGFLESNNEGSTKGMKIFGYSDKGGINIDSISSMSILTPEEESLVLFSMDFFLKNVDYPRKRIKVGKSFQVSNSVPIPPFDITMEISSTYTLKDIKNGIGYFDLGQVYTLKYQMDDFSFDLEGFGQGSCNYDIEKQFFTKHHLTSETTLKATSKRENIAMELFSKNIVDQSTVVIKREEYEY